MKDFPVDENIEEILDHHFNPRHSEDEDILLEEEDIRIFDCFQRF